MAETLIGDRALLRLLAWSSPAFPIGAFAFSHGLETAVEEGLVGDAQSLFGYIRQVCRQGSGHTDAVMFAEAYRAATDEARLGQVLEWAWAMRGSAELALEATMQGGAALRTLRLAWPHEDLDRLDALARRLAVEPALAVVSGVAARLHGLPLRQACLAQMAAFAANLVSAGVRLVPLGQTDGQRTTAWLEEELPAVVALALETPLEELATATPMIDLLSIAHETQYTRLFRS